MAGSTIVVSRSSEESEERRQFEEDLVGKLADAGAAVLVVPHIYYLASGHAALSRLAELPDATPVAASMHPRPAAWVLDALGAAHGEEARCYDVREYCCPGKCAEALLSGMDLSPGGGTVERFGERVSERWYPVLDYSRCVGCRQCYDFCLFGVYEVEDGRVVATEPDRCKPGCPACARVCPEGAIMFPESPDPGIAGAPGAEVESGPVDVEAFFSEQSVRECLCESGTCGQESACACESDELDGLIEALEDLED